MLCIESFPISAWPIKQNISDSQYDQSWIVVFKSTCCCYCVYRVYTIISHYYHLIVVNKSLFIQNNKIKPFLQSISGSLLLYTITVSLKAINKCLWMKLNLQIDKNLRLLISVLSLLHIRISGAELGRNNNAPTPPPTPSLAVLHYKHPPHDV